MRVSWPQKTLPRRRGNCCIDTQVPLSALKCLGPHAHTHGSARTRTHTQSNAHSTLCWDTAAITHTRMHARTHALPLVSSLPREDKVFSFLSTVSVSSLILTSPRHLFSIPTKGIQISPVSTEDSHDGAAGVCLKFMITNLKWAQPCPEIRLHFSDQLPLPLNRMAI